MGMFEYEVGLAAASTPDEMKIVADAFKAGQQKERNRIETELSALSNGYDHLHIALFKLRKIINNDSND